MSNILDVVMGASTVGLAISYYFIGVRSQMLVEATGLAISAVLIGLYMAETLAKSDNTAFGNKVN